MDPVDRERIVIAIRQLEDAVREARRSGRLADLQELTREVLARVGVDPSVYSRATAEDPDLASLEQAALREAIADVPDPGPYDCISREAPTGRPGDLSVTAARSVIRS